MERKYLDTKNNLYFYLNDLTVDKDNPISIEEIIERFTDEMNDYKRSIITSLNHQYPNRSIDDFRIQAYVDSDYDDSYIVISSDVLETEEQATKRINKVKEKEDKKREKDLANLRKLIDIYGVPE